MRRVKRSAAWLLRGCERAVDRLPKALELAGNDYGRTVAAAIAALLPERSAAERDAILRGVVRHRLINRALHVVHERWPAFALAISRCVPLRASSSAAAALRDGGAPLIVASAHFGPLFFQSLVLGRLLHGRRVIIVLRDRALYLGKMVPLMRRQGYEPLLADQRLLPTLRRALRDDPRTVVLIVFDHTHHGRRIVPFLGGAVTTSSGTGLLADGAEVRVVCSFWEWNRGRPRVVLEGPYGVDHSLEPAERRRQLLKALYELLERRVALRPEQWSGWFYVAPSIVCEPQSEAVS